MATQIKNQSSGAEIEATFKKALSDNKADKAPYSFNVNKELLELHSFAMNSIYGHFNDEIDLFSLHQSALYILEQYSTHEVKTEVKPLLDFIINNVTTEKITDEPAVFFDRLVKSCPKLYAKHHIEAGIERFLLAAGCLDEAEKQELEIALHGITKRTGIL
jgi:hypothetical protein